MFVLKLLGKLLKALRSGQTPQQLAGGFILGMILGLTPLMSLHNLLVVILIIIINVNISMTIFSFLLCSGFAYLIDPFFHSLGFWLLVDVTALKGLWITLAQMPIIALTRFNNTVVMGSLVSSLVLLVPVFILVKKGVVFYRENVDAKVQKLKIIQLMKSSSLYSIYTRIKDFGG